MKAFLFDAIKKFFPIHLKDYCNFVLFAKSKTCLFYLQKMNYHGICLFDEIFI